MEQALTMLIKTYWSIGGTAFCGATLKTLREEIKIFRWPAQGFPS